MLNNIIDTIKQNMILATSGAIVSCFALASYTFYDVVLDKLANGVFSRIYVSGEISQPIADNTQTGMCKSGILVGGGCKATAGSAKLEDAGIIGNRQVCVWTDASSGFLGQVAVQCLRTKSAD